MVRSRRIAAAIALAAIAMCGSKGAAPAHADRGDITDGTVSGTLSNLGSANSTGHSAFCGNPLAIGSPASCAVEDDHASDHAGKDSDGGRIDNDLLSGILSWNSTGHSNNCGNGLVAVLNNTTCVTKHGH
ncbi:hypothetical protein [Streptomyces sp. UNOC14_S4]|uniref:hypothetical protein n=1 Tax=Streptomyces sp. UNOC14_S4 TaxID=2872340 RepID=UPI001E655435|nr:hypothetical protein [Streptomyces sp. UNOC14_S4]MCC3770546.1 hypothetical protein [Streptomyces sp. UNOC14_S4]